MEIERAVTLLQGFAGTAASLEPDVSSRAFTQWFTMCRSTLDAVLGPDHSISGNFRTVSWSGMSSYDDWTQAFNEGRNQAVGLLNAAVFELTTLRESSTATDDLGTDAELWTHVAPEVRSEAWGKAAREAVIFTEDRIRRWAGRPTSETTTRLAVTVFGEQAEFRLGREPNEKQGWQNLVSGLMAAVRNVDAHRLQERADHKRYALGVIGTCSLILTQMRYEHGNRFHDTSAVPLAVTRTESVSEQ